jgi:hypothetical protein
VRSLAFALKQKLVAGAVVLLSLAIATSLDLTRESKWGFVFCVCGLFCTAGAILDWDIVVVNLRLRFKNRRHSRIFHTVFGAVMAAWGTLVGLRIVPFL